MVEVSKGMADYIKGYGRTFKAKLVTTTGRVLEDEIKSLKIESWFTNDNIGVGDACGAAVDVTLLANVTFHHIDFELFLGAVVDRKTEWISMGHFGADNPKNVRGVVTFRGLNRMCTAFSGAYTTDLSFPTTSRALVEELCRRHHIKLATDLPELPVEKNVFSPEMTDRDVLGYLAGYHGMSAHLNRKDEMVFTWYRDTGYLLEEDRFAEPELDVVDYTLGRIECNNGSKVLSCGDGELGFSFDNPLMTQERLEAIFRQITPMVYRPAEVNQIMGDPRIEPGDLVTMELRGETYRLPVMQAIYHFDGGLSTQLSVFGKKPSQLIQTSITTKMNQIVMGTNVKLTDMETALLNSNKAFAMASGLYTTIRTMEDGSKTVYQHDKPTLEESVYILMSNAQGTAWTNDGWNDGEPFWRNTVDKDGNMIINTLMANKIKADCLEGGRLQSMNGKTWVDMENGRFNFADNFKLDENGQALMRCSQMETLEGDYRFIMRDNQAVLPKLIGAWEKNNIELEEGTTYAQLLGQALDFMRGNEIIGSVCFTDIQRKNGTTLPILNLYAKGVVFDVPGYNSTSINENGVNAAAINISSTEDIKENIVEAGSALPLLDQAKVYTYNLKKESDGIKKSRKKVKPDRHGFVIGREVPDALLSPDGKHIDLYNTVSILWKALQETRAELTELKTRISY